MTGHPQAYAQLVIRHERAVRAVAWSVLGDHHIAEDVAQDVFLLAYEKLRQLRRGDAFCGWVCRMARRCAIQVARKRQKLPTSLPDVPLATAGEPDRQDMDQDLMRAIHALPERLRTIILMTYFEQRTADEIAQIQGCRVGTVTKLLSRARRRIRHRLEEKSK